MRTFAKYAFLSWLALTATACTWQSNSGSSYSSRETQREQTVRMGTIESVREVTIDRQPTGVGTGAGAVIGGVAGSNVGKGKGAVVGTVLGAVLGGVAGHAIEGQVAKVKGVELTIKLDNGELRAIVQEADEVFHPGERVRLLSSGGTTRVSH